MTIPSKKPPLILGVTGPIGSGVSTVARVLGSMGFRHYRVSETIRQGLAAAGGGGQGYGPDRRPTLQDFGNAQRREHGPQYWLTETLKGDSADQPIVVDGIRNLGEIRWMREHYPTSFVVAVIALRDTRWDRLKSSPDYAGHEAIFDRDDKRDWDQEEGDTWGQQVQKCVLAADYVFVNDEHLGAASARDSEIKGMLAPSVSLMSGKESRTATSEELHMATAYSQSHGSQCLKRRVGAVIVGLDGLPLSLGYNENPVGTKPCVHEFNYCFKDNDMEEKMERMRDVFCRHCGAKNDRLHQPWVCSSCKKSGSGLNALTGCSGG